MSVHRMPFFTILMLFIISIIVACGGYPDGDSIFKKGPYLMYTDSSSVTIKWETELEAESVVEYGKDDTLGAVGTGLRAKMHEVRLTGLEQGKLYRYRVGDGETMGGIHSAHTAAAPGEAFKFAVYGDTQSDIFAHSKNVWNIAERGASFVIHTGDEVQDGDDETQWQSLFFDPIRVLSNNIPYYVAIGNHERNSPLFYKYTWYPSGNSESSQGSHYSFIWGDVFFIVFDSPGFIGGIEDPQYAWAAEVLSSKKAREAKWRVAVWHETAYAQSWELTECDYEGAVRFRDTLIPLLETSGVQLILNGHEHAYQTGVLNGVRHVVTGGGGANLENHRCTSFPWVTKEVYAHHFLSVDVGPSEMRVTAVGLDNQEMDTFTIAPAQGW